MVHQMSQSVLSRGGFIGSFDVMPIQIFPMEHTQIPFTLSPLNSTWIQTRWISCQLFLKQNFVRVLSIEYSDWSGLNDTDWIVSKYVPASYFVRWSESRCFRSNELVDYLKKKLDTVDQSLSDLECSVKHSDKDSMDLKFTKNALDQHKVTKHLFFQ